MVEKKVHVEIKEVVQKERLEGEDMEEEVQRKVDVGEYHR